LLEHTQPCMTMPYMHLDTHIPQPYFLHGCKSYVALTAVSWSWYKN
jgi:hypothetical protein